MTNRRINNDSTTPEETPETPTVEETPETPTVEEKEETPTPEETNIVYRQPIVNEDGTPGVKEHGPMPVSEWTEYEKENKL